MGTTCVSDRPSCTFTTVLTGAVRPGQRYSMVNGPGGQGNGRPAATRLATCWITVPVGASKRTPALFPGAGGVSAASSCWLGTAGAGASPDGDGGGAGTGEGPASDRPQKIINIKIPSTSTTAKEIPTTTSGC